MKDLPFDPYDFFGYLASGLLILITMDMILGFPSVLGQDFKVIDTLALALAAYVAGQLVATPAKGLLEYGLIDKVLGRPSINLLKDSPSKLGVVFRDYYKPLPSDTRIALRERLGKKELAGEALFLAIRFAPGIRDNDALIARLGTFLNKYGFARNLAFTSAVCGIVLVAKGCHSGQEEFVRFGATALVVSLLLTYRYLKFFRQYSYELFNWYAAPEVKKESEGQTQA